MDRLTPGQTRTLASFIQSTRPDWNRPGIEAALEKAKGIASAADLAVAAIRASQVPENTTPAIIALDGPHWSQSSTDPYFPPAPRHERCSVCGKPKTRCLSKVLRDHDFDPDIRPDLGIDTKRTVQALRSEVAPPPKAIEPKSLDQFLPATEPAQEASA